MFVVSGGEIDCVFGGVCMLMCYFGSGLYAFGDGVGKFDGCDSDGGREEGSKYFLIVFFFVWLY